MSQNNPFFSAPVEEKKEPIVDATNPFLNPSMESNELDANDDNPLLKAEDPEKAAEEAAKTEADDFEVIQPETVENETVKEDDIIFEGEVEDKVKESNNIVKEINQTGDALQAMASVAQEMFQIIAQNGKLEPVEMMVAQSTIASCEALVPALADSEIAMPSMEDFKTVGMQYTSSQVSLESILDKIATAINNLGLNLERLFKNGIGLARSITPLIDNQIARATKLRGSINAAHRDAGQKEVTGKFVKALAVEGRAPDAATVLKTAAYTNQVLSEILSSKVQDQAIAYVKQCQKVLTEAATSDSVKSPSVLMAILANMFLGTGWIAQVHAEGVREKYEKQIKFDGTVAPELFKLFPNTAKVRDSNWDTKLTDAQRSHPLFGNRAIVVTQYKQHVTADARFHFTPDVMLRTLGAGSGKNMQALTSAQQADVLDSAIAILQTARTYFKEYASRNKACMIVWQGAFQKVLEINKRKDKFSDSVARPLAHQVIRWYTAMYWDGIFYHQSKLANYGRKTATALIDLVAASSTGAQGGTPSSESIDLENPFLV